MGMWRGLKSEREEQVPTIDPWVEVDQMLAKAAKAELARIERAFKQMEEHEQGWMDLVERHRTDYMKVIDDQMRLIERQQAFIQKMMVALERLVGQGGPNE